ncbi:MAG TPA: CUB domain-containing protein [Bacteroidia bacterium]
MKKIASITALCLSFFLAFAKQDPLVLNPYKASFDKAYLLYPELPKGVLEAVAFTNSRFHHITHQPGEEGSCMGLPKAYGVMGLTLDGQNYFRNNLLEVAQLSGYSKEDIINDPEKNILAYARAFNFIYSIHKNIDIELSYNLGHTFTELSELPNGTDQVLAENFALSTQLYEYLSFLNSDQYSALYGFPKYNIDLENYFGANYKVLSAKSITVSSDEIKNNNGDVYRYDPNNNVQSPDYGPAIWNPASSCNYSSGRSASVTAVTIHDVEGSYAGAISWFQNCQASVSAHYVVRSSDGQITQMVLESNTAWHVGTENSYTVGIEHEGYQSQTGWYTVAMYTASAALTADICASHNISLLRTGFWPWLPTTYYNQSSIPGSCCKVKGHMHFPNQTHNDPGPNWDWDYYYKLIDPPSVNSTLTTATGNFYDSGGPNNNYSDDERSIWTISPANATSVTLTFSSFDVENTWDYVYIYDGPDVWSPRIGYWTGTNSPGTVTANSGTMTIEFRSDCATNSTGWNAAWTSSSNIVLPTNLAVTQNTCPQIGVTLNWNNSGAGWYVDVSDDPNFGTFYNKAVANLTNVACPGGFCDYPNCTTYLKFRPNTTYYWRIWNGSSETNGTPFTTPVCSTTDNNCSGTIDDSGGPSNSYSGNEDYTYTISPTNASSVSVNFSAFDLETNFDSLYIYDGATINAPLIGSYTGTNSPGNISSTGGSVTLHFISDPFVNNTGFAATWSCTQLSTGLSESDELSQLGIYPNPAGNEADLHYLLKDEGPVKVELVDMLGRELILSNRQQAGGEHALHIDINALALAKGLYDVRIITSKGNANIKLIVK